MKDSARRRTKIQETTTEQVMFAAMRDARATLHEAVVAAGMSALAVGQVGGNRDPVSTER